MKNKRGQFYLVAAIVIIAIVVGVAGISNYSKKSSDRELKDLQIELNSEIEKTFEYISNNEISFSQSLVIWKNLSTIYLSKIGTNKNSVFMLGNSSNITLKGYKRDDSSILYVNYGSGYEILANLTGNFEKNYAPSSSKILIKENDSEYSFELRQGQSFYYLISKYNRGENIIIKR